ADIYSISSEECVNSDQSVTSDSFDNYESPQIDLDRDFEDSLGQDFDDFQGESDSKSLPDGLTNNKFSTLSTIYDKSYENENLTQIENSDQFFCTNPGCHEAFACEEDLRNHLLLNRNVIPQQQSEANMDPKRQYHFNMANIDANELDSYKRLENSKYKRNDRKNDSYNRQQSKINFSAKNNHRNNLNITQPFICDEERFTSGSYSNGYNVRNHSKSSQDDDNRHLIFEGQKYEHNFSSKNILRIYLNRFQPTVYDEQRCENEEFTTRHLNSFDLTRHIHEENGCGRKFRAKKELKNQ
ncbi:9896_t:CDS:2, partial [Racocetra fulgida]